MTGTRERIITATNEQFRRQGYHGTSLKDITAAAEAPIGSIYHFFPGGKAELAEAVLRETGDAYGQLFVLFADAAEGPADAVADFFDGAAAVLEQTDFIDVCPIGSVAREIASTDDGLRRAADAVFTGWGELFGERLRAAGLPDDEADALAVTAIAALEGGFVLARCRRDADLLRTTGRQLHDLIAAAVARHRTRSRRAPRAAGTTTTGTTASGRAAQVRRARPAR